jgi:NAD(P)-dependent dehydrogenase (short-subunit alcohol dehydrogenase family)
MDLNLTNKVVLIGGGSKGIGLACAQRFLEEGARVAISSRSAENLSAAEAQLKGKGHDVFTGAADLSDPKAAAALVAATEAALGPVEILINSAGAAKRTTPQEITPETWHAAMNAKFFTYVHLTDAVIPGMAKRRAGAIVNIIGTGGKVASPLHLPGGAANAALMLVSAGLANAWGHAGIRVNAINPGATLTGRVQGALDAESRLTGKPSEELRKLNEARIPLGRYAEPEEIADAALFLASERASYVTGAQLTMDGGLTPLVV